MLSKLLRNPLLVIGIFVLMSFVGTVALRAVQLLVAANKPVQAFLALGGSAYSEVYLARRAKECPQAGILVSGGSEDPCVYLIFQKHGAPMENVWLEHCAGNTFENLYYSLAILDRWRVQKIVLVTDAPHSVRALPMAQILLGSRGIWVDLELIPEVLSQPASNTEKLLGIALSAGGALLCQFFQPHCVQVSHLSEVDMVYWNKHGFYCQPQAGVGRFDAGSR